MMAVFFVVIAHEKGFKFHAEPQSSAYSCYKQRFIKYAVRGLVIVNLHD